MDNDKPQGTNPGTIYPSAPSGTPGWALAFAFVSSIIVSNFLTAYLAIGPDVRQYLGNKKEIDLAAIAAAQEGSKRNIDSLLSVMGACTAQVARLSQTLGEMGHDKNLLISDLANCKKSLSELKQEKS